MSNSGENRQNEEICLAIAAARQGDVEHNVPQPQPRQPHNLQGLMRFAMDATRTEDAPGESRFGPMDEQRKKFLEETLKSMTVNVIEILYKNVNLLRNADQLPVDADTSEYIEAFDSIIEHVDRIDTAIDFHKIGGFVIFPPCLESVHASIRAGACDLLAELCQNNPYCQKIVTENELLSTLLNLLDKDIDENVQIKALYAISCNVRENSEGYEEFLKDDGLNILYRALQRPIDKIRTKAAFLLSCLSASDGALRDKLVNMNYIPLLISLISQERLPSHEHVLSLLYQLITDNQLAIAQCRETRYNFKNILRHHLNLVDNQSECLEERQYCEALLNNVFQEESAETDR